MTRPAANRGEGAYVVFTDEGRARGLARFLKPGFRHCLVILPACGHDISLDPLWGRMILRVHPRGPTGDIVQILKNAGHRLVCAPIYDAVLPRRGLALLTCVNVVKRALGLRAWWVQTPYQLYRYLNNRKDTP